MASEIVEVDCLNVQQHLYRTQSQDRSQIHHTKGHEEDCSDVFPLLFDEEYQSESVGEDSDHRKDEVHDKKDVLKIIFLILGCT